MEEYCWLQKDFHIKVQGRWISANIQRLDTKGYSETYGTIRSILPLAHILVGKFSSVKKVFLYEDLIKKSE